MDNKIRQLLDYKLNLIDSVELRVIRIKHEERMKYYTKLENFLGLEKDSLSPKYKKDLVDAISEAMIKTFS